MYVRELHAITVVVQKTLLISKEFIIEANQQSLKELMNQVIQTLNQQYYLRKLFDDD